MLGRHPGKPTKLFLKKETCSCRLPGVRPNPILMTEGRHFKEALSNIFFFSSMKSDDCSVLVMILSKCMGVVLSNEL